jgi:hypothetical protein
MCSMISIAIFLKLGITTLPTKAKIINNFNTK